MTVKLHATSRSVVVVGAFNPTIFHPSWFRLHQLVSADDERSALDAGEGIVSSEMTSVPFPICQVDVRRDRLQATARAPDTFDPTIDLVVAALRLLGHTRVSAFGLNYEAHVDLGGYENLDRFGQLLAPQEPWNPVTDELSTQDFDIEGMRSLTMEFMAQEFGMRRQVRIEPSAKFKHAAYFHVNHHVWSVWPVPDSDDPRDFTVAADETAVRIAEMASASFEASGDHVEALVDRVL